MITPPLATMVATLGVTAIVAVLARRVVGRGPLDVAAASAAALIGHVATGLVRSPSSWRAIPAIASVPWYLAWKVGVRASSAWQEREITLDSLLGSQLDGMADSVNVASKNRLERMLGQITQGNPSSMHPTTLHGASAAGQQQAVERRGQVHGGGGALANPFACGLELSMDSMGPGGKEESLFSQAVRQELAIASGDEL